MTNTTTSDLNPADLGLTSISEGASCCGGGGGGCGSSDAVAEPREEAAASVSTELQVTGMTCGHCVTSVTAELSALPGVTGVAVALVAGGLSTVTVQSEAPLATESVAAAIDEAGYALA
ncbi:heavy-metal-associated domain-containing protein [Microterricola viridarii]|uniref:Copper chaperone CopZ n=1 Tax=Microterricola viridarii TaxID=412690 RepID=A0A1H1MWN8_9MICO|nr:cation transporter [Microterricola viridarii]SDR91057.1 Copper chaperone CopZ [Microterricola viridarii]